MSTSTETATELVENQVNELADQNVDSTDTEVRYLAYGARLRTALRASTRYVAYVRVFLHVLTAHDLLKQFLQTSDIGEAFRPVVPPWVVTAAYGVSWLYLGGDVAYESYKAHRQGPSALEAAHFSETTRIGLVATQRAIFQSVASMYDRLFPFVYFILRH
jgi:mitochondrial fission process protein 1